MQMDSNSAQKITWKRFQCKMVHYHYSTVTVIGTECPSAGRSKFIGRKMDLELTYGIFSDMDVFRSSCGRARTVDTIVMNK